MGPPDSPGGLHAEASAPSLQPVLALITQGLNMHATRLDALARALARLERGALQQVESAEMARAEAERRAAEAYAHASEAYARAEAAETHAEAQLQAAVQASEGRMAAKHMALDRRLAELEARLDTLPPALEELRGRSSAHELVLATHEREIATERSERTAEISEQREAHAALSSRVDQSRDDAAAALAAAQESNHATHARLRETLGEHAERQRRHEARTSAVEEALPQHQEMIEELQQAHSTLQRAVTAEAAEAEKTRAHLAQLATVQAQLEQAQAQLSDTVQLGLARAVAAAETMRDDSDRISSALAELEGWSRRLERLEVDLSAAERRLDGAAEELRRQAASLEGAQRTSMLSATQQVRRLAAPPSPLAPSGALWRPLAPSGARFCSVRSSALSPCLRARPCALSPRAAASGRAPRQGSLRRPDQGAADQGDDRGHPATLRRDLPAAAPAQGDAKDAAPAHRGSRRPG